jgi:hypothetical protein
MSLMLVLLVFLVSVLNGSSSEVLSGATGVHCLHIVQFPLIESLSVPLPFDSSAYFTLLIQN